MILLLISIELFILNDFDGKSYNIREEIKENVVFIDFWASHCKPCIKMMPFLDSLYNKYKDSNLRLFGICLDSKKTLQVAKSIWLKNNLSYIPLWDWDNSVMKSFGVKEIPHLFIIDTEGKIVYEKKGFEEKEKSEIEDTLTKILITNMVKKSKKGGEK